MTATPHKKWPSTPKVSSFGSSAIFRSGDPPLSAPSSQRVRLSRDIPSLIIYYHENVLLSRAQSVTTERV
jgi:hypothetical protein